MNTKTAPLLSSNRRKFIVSTAGIVVAGLAATSPLSLLSTLNQGGVDLSTPTPAPAPKRLHLELPEAKRIASQFVAEGENDSLSFLDLAAYASISLDALDYLAPLDASFASLGFIRLDPAMAKLLARWKSHFLIFDNLDKLTPEITRVLNTTNHALIFSNLKRLDIEAVGYLVNEGTHPLSISLAELPLPLANVLSKHPHELSFRVSSLDLRAAKALSRHQGYYLHVNSKAPFSEDTLRVFSGNAMKHLTTDSIGNEYQLLWKATEEWWVSP